MCIKVSSRGNGLHAHSYKINVLIFLFSILYQVVWKAQTNFPEPNVPVFSNLGDNDRSKGLKICDGRRTNDTKIRKHYKPGLLFLKASNYTFASTVGYILMCMFLHTYYQSLEISMLKFPTKIIYRYIPGKFVNGYILWSYIILNFKLLHLIAELNLL